MNELGRVGKFEPLSGGCEMDHAEETVGQLIVADDDGPVNLQVTEHALDAVTLLIERRVMLDLPFGNVGTDGIGIVAIVRRAAPSGRSGGPIKAS